MYTARQILLRMFAPADKPKETNDHMAQTREILGRDDPLGHGLTTDQTYVLLEAGYTRHTNSGVATWHADDVFAVFQTNQTRHIVIGCFGRLFDACWVLNDQFAVCIRFCRGAQA
jgi:hypothetical protein